MSTVNKAIIVGRLGDDPDVRYTQANTAVANFSVATSDRYKDKSGEWKEQTEWHRVVAWGRLAEICQEYLRKGSQVYIEGPIQTRKWEDKEGRERYTTEIKALTMKMLDSKEESNTPSNGANDRSLDSSVDLNKELDEEPDLPF